MWNLEGQTAIVTGAAHGIGLATARLMVSAGLNVVLADIDSEALTAATESLAGDGRAFAVTTDVAQAESVASLMKETKQRFGKVAILFANAAIQLSRPVMETTEADWNRIQDVNLKGVYLCCRAVLPVMLQQAAGSIVISASGHAFATYRGFSAYAAAKGAVVAFMRGLALDYADQGIRANCVIPGATDTRLIQQYFESTPDPDEARRKLLDSIPMKRLASPEDVARAVLFLASDHASYVTGTCLAVDGGLMAQG
jgi:NAD(P)-dependent dehydrogenase (short-subunit alcohol dehydrogenase family)